MTLAKVICDHFRRMSIGELQAIERGLKAELAGPESLELMAPSSAATHKALQFVREQIRERERRRGP